MNRLQRLLTDDGILFAPPFAHFKVRLYFVIEGWRWGGMRGAWAEWRSWYDRRNLKTPPREGGGK